MRRVAFVFISIVGLTLLLGALLSTNEAFERRPPPPDTRKKPSGNDVPFTTIDSGSNSGVNVRHLVAIKDQAEWMALWRRHASNLQPPPTPPNVDFNSEMVVAVFSGERKSGGYGIQVDSIKLAGNKLVVIVSETSPGPGDITMMMITQPYHIVRLGKSTLPVVFQGL